MVFKNLLLLISLLVFTDFSTIAFKCRRKAFDFSINDEECDKKERFSIDVNTCRKIRPNKGMYRYDTYTIDLISFLISLNMEM